MTMMTQISTMRSALSTDNQKCPREQGARGQKVDGSYLLPVAIPESAPVSQMELRREVLLEGILAGFSQAYRILAPVSDSR